MKRKCIIIDDEPIARRILTEYISDVEFLEIAGIAEHPLKANALLSTIDIDIMFLDINMPRMNGMEYLKSIPDPPITIMTTAYGEYALDGFELNVLDYLVKPFAFERFLRACTKANEYFQSTGAKGNFVEQGEDYFFIKCNGRIEKIAYGELILLEARQNYVVLHTDTRKLIVYLTLKGISEKLPENIFLKIHKSSIINVNRIKSIEGNVVSMGPMSAMISQNLFDGVMKTILKDRMIRR